MAKHFLAVETQVEDTGIKKMLQKLYNEEFNEVQSERKHRVIGELENLKGDLSKIRSSLKTIRSL